MGRAETILHENAEIIDNMMKQMDDFADAHGGYINRSGVGNFRTQPVKDDKSEGVGKKVAAGLGAAALGAGATLAAQTPAGQQVMGHAKQAYKAAKPVVSGALQTARKKVGV